MATEVATQPGLDAVQGLRDVLLAHQGLAPGAGIVPAPASTQQAERLARDVLALVQSEIDTQVAWRVQQAVDRLRAEGLVGPTPETDATHERAVSAALSIPTMALSIPIIAIAGGIGGFPGLVLALAALVLINLTWSTRRPPWQQRRR